MSTLSMAIVVIMFVVGVFSSMNVVTRDGLKPEFNLKQGLLDLVCVLMAILNAYICFADAKTWELIKSMAEDILPEYSVSGGTVLVFSILVIVVANVCFYHVLRFISLTTQEVKFAYEYRKYEYERRARRAAKKKAEAEIVQAMKARPDLVEEMVADMKAGETRIIKFPVEKTS